MSENWSIEFEAGMVEYEAAQDVSEDGDAVLEADDLQEWRIPDDDCPLDGDAESALASAGFGTDEDYEHYDAWELDYGDVWGDG